MRTEARGYQKRMNDVPVIFLAWGKFIPDQFSFFKEHYHVG